MDRNTGRMDLRKARIGEESTFLIALPCCRTIAIHCIGREEVSISIPTGCNDNGMGAEALQFTRYKVAGDDTLCLAVHDDQVKHFMARITLNSTCCNLLVQGSIRSQQQLLASLSASVECTAYLHAAEGTVGKVSAIFPRKRNTLGDTLVNDRSTHFCETVHVCFAAAVVTSLDGIIEKAVDGVIVVLVILGSVDTSLCGNRVCTARRIADTEHFHIVAQFTERSSCRSSTQTGTDYDDFKFPFVVRTDKSNF